MGLLKEEDLYFPNRTLTRKHMHIWEKLRNGFSRVVNKTAIKTIEPQSETSQRLVDRMMESGDFSIDLTRRTATLRGQPLQLTSEEFDILVFLVGHPKSFITPHTVLAKSDPRRSRAEIFWDLLSLRSKLDAAGGPGKHYLRTEPWIAYRFDPTSLSTT
jgi:DNA-binding response OmpR family regulator